jgi:hypothetical protein
VDVDGNTVSRKRPDGSYVLDGTRYNDNFVSNYDLDNVTELNRELKNFKETMKADPNAVNSLQFKY